MVLRLDELHIGIKAYLKGAFAFADIKDPKAILDIGFWRMVWPTLSHSIGELTHVTDRAIQAAQQYPDATIPHREIGEILKRTIDLLKPNGWLLIEDSGRHTGHENSPGPAQSVVDHMFIQMLHAKGLDPFISERLSKLLDETRAFAEINVKCERLILSTDQTAIGHDDGTRKFSNALRHTLEKIVRNSAGGDLEAAGLTKELREAWLDERQDPRFKTFHDFWFFWSCKQA
ncbi:hypothetical protein C0995_012405 [Termitomyces sp. Mi166|nr:hypothetical protein C0995_012405 [Termitomyces sp. Mi166\